jgi:poly(3-hydroxyalkanoate) synthetase
MSMSTTTENGHDKKTMRKITIGLILAFISGMVVILLSCGGSRQEPVTEKRSAMEAPKLLYVSPAGEKIYILQATRDHFEISFVESPNGFIKAIAHH